MSWKVEQRNGIYLPEIDWHLDARKPTANAFVSHAHFDHLGKHSSILCSKGTAHLIKARMPGERDWRTYDFQEPFEIEPGVQAMLYPAGHIPGSAMLWLEKDGSSFLYTGDFKLSPSLCAEPCVVPQADTLVIETTYGIPRYTFPPSSEVVHDIVQFCRDTLENGDTPILFGYSLGKSQEILRALSGSELRIMLHSQVFKMTQACEEIGFKFPPYSEFEYSAHKGHVIISPPLTDKSDWLAKIPNRRTAQVSGWAIDPSTIHSNPHDRAFPLSDHADFLDLQDFVAQVSPKTVYTTHGFAKEFAQTLNEQGIDAWALGKQNQMGLGLPAVKKKSRSAPRVETPEPLVAGADAIIHFAEACETIAKTDSRRRKVEIIAQYFASLDATDISTAALFIAGQLFPRVSRRQAKVDRKLNKQAVLFASKSTETDYKLAYQNIRDSQSALASMLSEQRIAHRTLSDFRSLFDNLEQAPNPVFQHSILAEEYRKLIPLEGKYLMRLISGDLKAGISEAIIEEALSVRFEASLESIQQANLRCSDLERVANAIIDQLLEYIPVQLFHPLKLVSPSPGQIDLEFLSTLNPPIWVEDLHDGLRCQIHKVDERVELFDEEHLRISHKFPEILEAAVLIPQDFIADGTLIAWKKEEPLPYSELAKRLHRPAEELFLGEDIGTLFWLHDLLWHNGESLLEVPLSQRKRHLNSFSVNTKLRISPVTFLDSAEGIHSYLQDSKSRGNKGLITKDETSPYNPLSSKPAWHTLE